MISGYFLVGAYERHGFGRFLRNRLVRLGIPVLVFAGLMVPVRIFLFGEHIARWDDVVNAAHLWYLEHVLLFSVVYALWRRVRDGSGRNAGARPRDAGRRTPGVAVTFGALLVVAAVCGLVRIWSPIDRWMNLLGFFRAAFADVPRDLAFFIFGAMAFRRSWFEQFPTRRGMLWLAVGLGAAAAWYALAVIPHRWFGPLGSSIFYLVWEEMVCFGLCIGLLVLFRQVLTAQGSFGRMLAANQYSAYFWHPILIVGIQMAFLSAPLGPLAKFAAVTLIGVPLVFLWSWLLRRIPAVRAVL
jgi:surface polysaccharide O-acyltransferase-like enzyme